MFECAGVPPSIQREVVVEWLGRARIATSLDKTCGLNAAAVDAQDGLSNPALNGKLVSVFVTLRLEFQVR